VHYNKKKNTQRQESDLQHSLEPCDINVLRHVLLFLSAQEKFTIDVAASIIGFDLHKIEPVFSRLVREECLMQNCHTREYTITQRGRHLGR